MDAILAEAAAEGGLSKVQLMLASSLWCAGRLFLDPNTSRIIAWLSRARLHAPVLAAKGLSLKRSQAD